MNSDPIYIFRKTWGTYQKVIRHNLMFHREITEAARRLLKSRPGPLNVIDLGCGDAAHIGKILEPGQVAEYCGCDLSPYALDVARNNLIPFGIRVNLLCRDMIAVLKEAPENHFDLVYSGYALHHLPIEAKQAFFTESRRILRENGCVILVDVMREEGNSRPEYLDNYNGAVATQWLALTPDERDQVQEHIRNCDFPETPGILQSLAENAGLNQCRRLEKRTWHEAWCYQKQD
ncbi:MAG: methyltransferase domain-containing protein [Chlorobiaceae bacterium]|nr:methyltransferase domain-containing protein [Chlorobiaceae bacterium]